MTDCNRCGRCCDPVTFERHPMMLRALRSEQAAADLALADPRTDEGWAWWQAHRGATDYPGAREQLWEVLQPGHPNQATADFITEHWHVVSGDDDPMSWDTPGQRLLRCDMFDPATRLCTAHEARPPVCSGYPWYGQEPDRTRPLHATCSFNADVRTTLPIVAITNREGVPA